MPGQVLFTCGATLLDAIMHPLMRTSYADLGYGRSYRLAYSDKDRFRSPSEVHSAL